MKSLRDKTTTEEEIEIINYFLRLYDSSRICSKTFVNNVITLLWRPESSIGQKAINKYNKEVQNDWRN
jgi:hypothetical protein